MKWMLAALFLALMAVIVSRILWELNHFQVTEYTIHDPRFAVNQKPVKTAVLADLHNRVYGRDNERLLAAIDRAAPSCILIAGDMTVAEPGKSTVPASRLVRALSQRYPVCYGMGNHEYRMKLYPDIYGEEYARYEKCLADGGVSMLHNERQTVFLGKVEADVYGLELDRIYYRRFRKTPMEEGYLEQTLPPKREGIYKILLAHSPFYFPDYEKWGADLTISGHVHGGVVRIGKRGLISPSIGLFPSYSGGIYERNGKKMLVSRGLGAHTIPIRLFNRPELIILNFEK